MNISQTTIENANLLTVTDQVNIFSLYLTVEMHESNTPAELATELVYIKALMGGAGKYTKDEFIDAVKLLGGSIDISFAGGDITFEVAGLTQHEQALTKLLSVLLEAPRFTPAEVIKAKKLKINQLEMDKENAKERAHDALRNKLFDTDSRQYSPSEDALIAAVKKVTPADLKKFHQQLRGSFWQLSVAGSKSSTKLLNQLLGSQNMTTKRTLPVQTVNIPKQRVQLIAIPSKQNIEFSIGGPVTIDASHEDYPALVFGLGVLGMWGGFSGRLMSTVREEEGLTYGIYANINAVTYTEPGYWRIMTFFAPDKTEQGIKSTLRELHKIIDKGITNTELERFKNIYHTRFDLSNDSLTQTLGRYHGNMLKGGTPEDFAKTKDQITKLTKKQVNAALKKHLDLAHLQICGAGPVAGLQKPIEKLL